MKQLASGLEIKTLFSNTQDLLPLHQQFLAALINRRDSEVAIKNVADILQFMVSSNFGFAEIASLVDWKVHDLR
jgi:hypothetical protein